MVIKIKFDPNDSDIKDIFLSRTAWTLWCLWRRGHIVSQHFDNAVREIAKRIDKLPLITVSSLIESFQGHLDFIEKDVASFVGEYMFYFSSPLEYPITIQRVD